jgi:hypothetical protein
MVLVVGESHHAGGHVLRRDVADVGAAVEVRDASGENEDARAESHSLQALLDGRAARPARER